MTKLVAAFALIVVVIGYSSSHVAYATVAHCGITPPPTFLLYDLKSVLAALAKETTPKFSPHLFYPTNRPGSVMGHAECHTYSEKRCTNCLGLAGDSLVFCDNSQKGTYDDQYCSMKFWQIKY
ncbi:hypothetical protein LINGRAHAP2_LOCUS33730 [Linum grandiflorum]